MNKKTREWLILARATNAEAILLLQAAKKLLGIIPALCLVLAGCQQQPVPPPPPPPDTVQAVDTTPDQIKRIEALLRTVDAMEASSCGQVPACQAAAYQRRGSADIPIELRVENYHGGSCVHASTGTMFGNGNRQFDGKLWTQAFDGGETSAGLRAKLDSWGVDWAGTCSADQRLLDWCHRTSRIAVIDWKTDHVCNFIRWQQDDQWRWWSVVLDNNDVGEYEYMLMDQFLAKWRSHGGCATALVDPANAPTLFQ